MNSAFKPFSTSCIVDVYILENLSLIEYTYTKVCFIFEVTWNVSTRPIVLGKLVILTCDVEKLSGKFEHKKLQWIGKGQGQSEFLCYGSSGRCSNDNKYKVTIRNSSFDLEIQNFNVRDLDVVYTCVYGYDTFPKMLSWNTEKVLCKYLVKLGSCFMFTSY